MSEPMYISLARACQASDASQNEKILAGIVLQQHAELEALKRVNQDNINSFHSAIARAEKAEAEVDRLKDVLRRGHNELEIRMSHNNNHLLKIITDQELRNLEWPMERIQKEAGLMYQKLRHYEE